jgi:hypothetical protein
LVLTLVALVAVAFSVVMPVVDSMFDQTLEEECRAYLPSAWEDYHNNRRRRMDGGGDWKRRMELWDALNRFKAEALRSIVVDDAEDGGDWDDDDGWDDDGADPGTTGRGDRPPRGRRLWEEMVTSHLLEGEDLHDRPDLIARLEEALIVRRYRGRRRRHRRPASAVPLPNTGDGNKMAGTAVDDGAMEDDIVVNRNDDNDYGNGRAPMRSSSRNQSIQSRILGTEFNRLDLVMRFFSRPLTEYAGRSRRDIYTDFLRKKGDTQGEQQEGAGGSAEGKGSDDQTER